jgi:hypothetical protein
MKNGSSKLNSCGSIANQFKNPSQDKALNSLNMAFSQGKLERDSLKVQQN